MPKRPERILVSLAWSMPRSFATSSLDEKLVYRRSKVLCPRKQRDGRGLNPGTTESEFELLTDRPQTARLEILKSEKKAQFKFLMSREWIVLVRLITLA